MNCQRCQGLMVRDRAYDLQDSPIHCDMWRCICCGNMLDTQMLGNKRKSVATVHPIRHVPQFQMPTAA